MDNISLNGEAAGGDNLYKYLYEHAHEMYVSVSPTDASILKVNETLCNNLNYTKEELIGQSIFKLYHDDCMDAVHAAFDQFKSQGQVRNAELILKKKEGEKVHVMLNVSSVKDENGKILYSRSSWVDITEFKEKEKELTRVRNRLKDTNEAARIGTWDLDLVNSKLEWSEMTKIIHEVPLDYEPVLEKGISFYKEGASRDAITQAVSKSMEDGSTYELELQIITAKNNERWVKAIGLADFEEGNCIRLYGTFQDIHKRKTAELELERLLEITTDQNQRLLNFAHIVSHNLRTHSGNLGMTLDFYKDASDTDTKKELMQMLETSISNLEETVEHLNEVVAVNVRAKENLEAVVLNNHLEAAIGNVNALLKLVGGQIRNEIHSEIVVDAVPAYLDSILLNFLTNAIKYCSSERMLEINISCKRVNHQVAITISDNGKGIDLQRHGDNLFGMYKTFHGNRDAKGIGLFITKNQIEAMGGTVMVASEVNTGTSFTIYLNEVK